MSTQRRVVAGGKVGVLADAQYSAIDGFTAGRPRRCRRQAFAHSIVLKTEISAASCRWRMQQLLFRLRIDASGKSRVIQGDIPPLIYKNPPT